MASKRNNHGRIQGRAGVELRKRRLQLEPLCRECAKQGIVRAAVTPDHIIALANGGTDTDDNVQCLCAEHHDAKTAKDLGYKQRPTTGLDGWPLS
jgi:5-methylcytosine-specific restriction protein A